MITYQIQHEFEGGWINDGKPHQDAEEAREELARQRSLWPDEYRVLRVKTKVLDW